MSTDKLKRLRKDLEDLRRKSKGGIRAEELERFAKKLGRVQTKRDSKSWESTRLPHMRPISIHRNSKPIKPFTAGNILDAFEADLQELEEQNDKEN